MKRIVLGCLILAVSASAAAQDEMEDGSRVVLPIRAQECNLAPAPPPIPENAMKEDLLKAQKNVKQFQADMETYRTCINENGESEDLTSGNRAAIANAHNYSVDMEERVAAMFNDAVRAYKAAHAKK